MAGQGAGTGFQHLTVNPQTGPADHVRHLFGADHCPAPRAAFPHPLKVLVEDRNGMTTTARTKVTFTVIGGKATFQGAGGGTVFREPIG